MEVRSMANSRSTSSAWAFSDVLPGRHGDCPGQETCNSSHPDDGGIGAGPGDAQDEGNVGNQPVAHPEDGGPGRTALDVSVSMDHPRRPKSS